MLNHEAVPAPVAEWLSRLPQTYCGTLYAKVLSPHLRIPKWIEVEAWGQICDGKAHRDLVHLTLYNKFRNHGKGWTYVEWKAEPDCPEQNDRPRGGLVKDPKPYSGIAYDSGGDGCFPGNVMT